MAKKGNRKKVASKEESLPKGQKPQEKPKKLLVWGLQATQKAALIQAQERYTSEAKVITRYQEDNWKRILVAIAKEVGIPEDINVRLDFPKMALIEVPIQPVESTTTQDLTKVPNRP